MATMCEYMTRDEYVDLQNKLNDQIRDEVRILHGHVDQMKGGVAEALRKSEVATKAEFTKVHREINDVRTEMRAEFKDVRAEMRAEIEDVRREMRAEFIDVRREIQELRDETRAGFQQVHGQIKELQAQHERTWASQQNNRLRKLHLPIRPVPILLPEKGLVWPGEEYFPRNAHEFYQLRTPDTGDKKYRLACLAAFYDIAEADPSLVLDYLEDILGLCEENFIDSLPRAQRGPQRRSPRTPQPRFQRRARRRVQGKAQPGTRPQWTSQVVMRPNPDQPNLSDASMARDPDASEETRIGWNPKWSPYPSVNQVAATTGGQSKDGGEPNSDDGTPTNPITSSTGSRMQEE